MPKNCTIITERKKVAPWRVAIKEESSIGPPSVASKKKQKVEDTATTLAAFCRCLPAKSSK